MKTQLRQIGNSIGQIVPAPLLRELGLQVGDELDLVIANGQLIAKPIKKHPKYTLDELLAKCDDTQPVNDLLTEWEAIEAVGAERDI